ncbi:MAG: hypothetical protein Q9223_005090 [Gallowayella weberi]
MKRRMFEDRMSSFPRSKIWDETTQRSVDRVRSYIHRLPRPTISQLQHESAQERPLKGPVVVQSEILPPPIEDDIRQALFRTIEGLGKIEFEKPTSAPVPVEWIRKETQGYRTDLALINGREPAEQAMERSDDLMILHVHGGAFFQGSPESYRPTTSQLALLSGGQVVSVGYRLSPQNVFPAALLDVLIAYLSLLYPPPSSDRRPVDPSRVVFAGDSSGGVLLFGVLQVLLKAASTRPMRFHSHQIPFPIPKPSGIAILSLQGDPLHSLPSREVNRMHDLFLDIPWHHRDYPSCSIWPASPPRPEIYCPTRSFLHPLVSLALAKSWKSAPPIWLASGEELFTDGAKTVARRAALQDVNVTWVQFEAMPHCFPAVPGLTNSSQARILMEKWATFCQLCVKGELAGQPKVKASKVGFKDAVEQPIFLESPDDLRFEEIERRIKAKVDLVEQVFREELLNEIPPKL